MAVATRRSPSEETPHHEPYVPVCHRGAPLSSTGFLSIPCGSGAPRIKSRIRGSRECLERPTTSASRRFVRASSSSTSRAGNVHAQGVRVPDPSSSGCPQGCRKTFALQVGRSRHRPNFVRMIAGGPGRRRGRRSAALGAPISPMPGQGVQGMTKAKSLEPALPALRRGRQARRRPWRVTHPASSAAPGGCSILEHNSDLH